MLTPPLKLYLSAPARSRATRRRQCTALVVLVLAAELGLLLVNYGR